MSFADVKKGGARKPARAPAYQGEYQGTGNDLERERLRQEISSNLTAMKNKVNETKKQLKKLGSKKDTAEVRVNLEELQSDQLQLRQATLHMLNSFKSAGATAQVSKLSTDFKELMSSMSKNAAELQQKLAEFPEPTGSGGSAGGGPGDLIDSGPSATRPLLDADRQQQLLYQSRMDQNEEEIMRRDAFARQVESDVADLAEMMQDIAVITDSQSEPLGLIEDNVENTEAKTREATGQLIQAEKYQQGNRKLMCCLFQLLLIAVAGLILLLIFKGRK